MKKLVLTLTILLFALNSSSQSYKIGLDIGGNVMPIGERILLQNYNLGLNGGIYVDYALTDEIALSLGVYYSQKKHYLETYDSTKLSLFGFEDALPGDDLNLYQYTRTKTATTQNYIEMPLLIKYEYKMLEFFGGPYFGFMIGAKTVESVESNVPLLQTIDINSFDESGLLTAFLPPKYAYEINESSSVKNLKSFDFGLRVGMAIKSEIGLGFRGSYSFGMIDYRTNDNQSTKQKYGYTQFSIFYELPLK
ncbi:porin family protein [Crocinitomix catalasitica]|uniref:porin family protein n=1 Tax=Crocinitomix catalasitica TaxID=184607 RepID=UPI0004890927|nr:porin family protein [Crocinitomix catalasitica]